jgi:pilus assembly protein CpaB
MARRSRPFVLLVFALASGAIAAALALRYLQRQATPIPVPVRRGADVVVAARALPIGAIVGERDIRLVEWPGGSLPAGFLGDKAEVVGRGLVAPIAENEPLLGSKLAARGAGGGLPVIIEEGMRAVSIGVDQVVGVSGFVLPNYRVDVLLTLAEGRDAKEPATRVLMQNVKTLAAGQSIQEDREGKPQTVPVVTLLVSPEQAETLALASSQGRIQLALRNSMDTLSVRTPGARLSSLLGASVPTPRRGRRPTARTAPDQTVIEVYRGGKRTLQTF